MDDLELEQRLLASARRGLSPSVEDTVRIKGALATRLLAPGGSESPDDLAPAVTEPAAGWLSKLLVLAAVSGVSASAGYVAGQRSRGPLPSPVVQLASVAAVAVPSAVAAPEPAPVVSPAPVASVIPRSSLGAPARPAALPPDEDAIEHEVQTVRRVERALRAGNPQLALSLLAELDASIPSGRLLEERRAAFTVASCEIGFGPSSQSLLEKFVKQYPSSVYLVRVRKSCTAPAETESPASGDVSGGRRE